MFDANIVGKKIEVKFLGKQMFTVVSVKSFRKKTHEVVIEGSNPGQSEMIDLCRQLLEANPKVLADLQAGKQKAIGALIGQAKKQNPNASPNDVRRICMKLVEDGFDGGELPEIELPT